MSIYDDMLYGRSRDVSTIKKMVECMISVAEAGKDFLRRT